MLTGVGAIFVPAHPTVGRKKARKAKGTRGRCFEKDESVVLIERGVTILVLRVPVVTVRHSRCRFCGRGWRRVTQVNRATKLPQSATGLCVRSVGAALSFLGEWKDVLGSELGRAPREVTQFLPLDTFVRGEVRQLGWGGQPGTRGFHNFGDLQEHVLANHREFRSVSSLGVGEQLHLERSAGKTRNSKSATLGLDRGMLFEHVLYAIQHAAQLFRRRFNSQEERLIDEHFGAARQVLKLHLRQRTIRNNSQSLIKRAHFKGAKSDVFDDTHLIADLAEVAHADCFVHQEGNASNQVFQAFLRGQRDRQSSDSQARQRRLYIHASDREGGEDRDQQKQDVIEPLHQD